MLTRDSAGLRPKILIGLVERADVWITPHRSRAEFRDDLNWANQSIVEVPKLVSGNPIFLEILAAYQLHFVLIEERLGNANTGDVPLPLAGTFQSRVMLIA
jgi:hypothetical protein